MSYIKFLYDNFREMWYNLIVVRLKVGDTDETEIYIRIFGENHQYCSVSHIKNTVYYYGLLFQCHNPYQNRFSVCILLLH